MSGLREEKRMREERLREVGRETASENLKERLGNTAIRNSVKPFSIFGLIF